MVFRKLGGFDKNGKVWVAKELPKDVRVKISVHMSSYKKEVLNGTPRREAIRIANEREHRGMTTRERQLYDLRVARLTKNLPVRKSYSPLGRA